MKPSNTIIKLEPNQLIRKDSIWYEYVGTTKIQVIKIAGLGTAYYRKYRNDVMLVESQLVNEYVDDVLNPSEEELQYLEVLFGSDYVELYLKVLAKIENT